MKLLYGVVGEGMGHAMRSRVILEHLTQAGHEVEIVASSRAHDFLAKRFEGVHRIHGLHMIYEENEVRLGKTAISNLVAGASGIPRNISAYFELISDFKPEAVISDFESWTHLYGQLHGLPVLSIDNMQIIHRCKIPDEITSGHGAEFQLTKAFIKGKLPFARDYFITTFFRPEIRKERTRLFPPILRPEILGASVRKGEHLLVYTTGEGNEGLARALQSLPLESRIYGMRRGLTEEITSGNLRYRPFSEDGFIDDLASCRAVVAGGGFTLMGESVFLRKPMLAVPLAGQFEQVLNARYLAAEGYGKTVPSLDDPAVLREFLAAVPRCEDKLASYTQDGNGEILCAVDEWLDKAEAGLP